MRKFVVVLFLLSAVDAYCPLTSNQSPSRPKCFSFYNWNKTFAEAEGFCTDMGGHLASITNAFEANLLTTVAQGKGVPAGFWLGANDIDQPGQFAWLDQTPWAYTRFASGEPSAQKQCLTVGKSDGTWVTADCETKLAFACAADIVNVAQPPCDSEWTWSKNFSSCYKVFFDLRTWQDAEALCTTVGAHLASVHSDSENRFVNVLGKSGLTVNDDEELYIGLTKNSQAQWVWTDGTPTDFLAWAPGEPNNSNGKESCVESYADPLHKPPKNADYVERWNDIECDDTMRAAVCKKAQNK